jgi:hypothetical protein
VPAYPVAAALLIVSVLVLGRQFLALRTTALLPAEVGERVGVAYEPGEPSPV